MRSSIRQMAIVGAGPVGLALALQSARTLPQAAITLFDARPVDQDVSGDPRTLALSLGSVQMLQRLGAWPAALAEPILQVHVSQQAPSLNLPFDSHAEADLLLSAQAMGLPQLGAVVRYGVLVQALQSAWSQAVAADRTRLRSRFGTPVKAVKNQASGAEIDAGIVEDFDLAVVAEGGVFDDQARKPVTRDYAQTAWVGTVRLTGATAGRAVERFTRQGPAALLPLPAAADGVSQAALVWCVASQDDPVRDLNDRQRLAVLNTIFPRSAGRLVGISSLKDLALGLNAERTLVRRRTVRIGNAAQTLHPVAGQGLNLGLRDVHTLVGALRSPADLDTALQRAEWQRAADRWSTIATTDFLARSFTWQWPGAAAIRGLGLTVLGATPPLAHWLARRMMFGVR